MITSREGGRRRGESILDGRGGFLRAAKKATTSLEGKDWIFSKNSKEEHHNLLLSCSLSVMSNPSFFAFLRGAPIFRFHLTPSKNFLREEK